ncbi:Panacea domain-containing protein [Devosia rhizoryzae]|uniref:SocA family protein n=1 Tax=Devosia rhizoryzae TaxID=2774137 RepID=A0ABX7C748_9HYPH|nr:Panacea domain-containing protein [Devosia rhizoryzae]QQR40084.1 SocA family protein [Devosia rhizoryzae]
MADLRSVMAYYAKNYPHKDELSKARLTKMVYLADWKAALDHGAPITDIRWRFNHYGPYVDDIHNMALEDPAFEVRKEHTMFGNRRERIELVDEDLSVTLSSSEREILDHVIAETRKLGFDGFIKLVYSTFPVISGTKGKDLDLIGAAETYRSLG